MLGIVTKRSYILILILGVAMAMLLTLIKVDTVSAAACAAPSTDYGTVSGLSVNVTTAGSYRVWSRMAAANTTDNTYLLEIDGNTCYTVGGSSVPTYTGGASTHFKNDTTNWMSKTSSGTQIDVTLSSGTHTIKLIGNAPDVFLDRLIMTQDKACVPSGTGENCANPPDTTSPVVSISSPANNATISSTTSVSANATDDVSVTKVEFYVDSSLKSTDTSSPYTYSFDPSSYSVGSHQLVAKAFDGAGNSATSSVVTVNVPDSTPPTISSVSAGSISQTSATVTWTTNEAADSQVKYGPTASYGSTTTLNASKVTSHSVGLTGLTASTTYHYQVISKDAAGNTTSSTDKSFTTQAPAGDTTAPTVSVTSPTQGKTVSGTISVTATASDNVGVAGVQFKLNGNNLGAEDTSSPYSISWDTSKVTNGSYTLTAVARDAAGNTKTANGVTVTVNNVSTYNVADINSDHAVNYIDLSLLAGNWGKTGGAVLNPRADMNGDGLINYIDLSILAGNWGK